VLDRVLRRPAVSAIVAGAALVALAIPALSLKTETPSFKFLPQNLEVVQTDKDRGLILVRGAVPGTKGNWVLVRDAVKRALPENAPKPGSFRKAGGDASAEPNATSAEQAS